MPLDTTRANAKTGALNEAFAAIGTSAATRMPASKRNTEPLAYEYHVASHLLRIAEARKKKAHARAVKAGLLFDPDKDPREVGTHATVYAGDVVEISVTVTTPGTRLEQAGLVVDLLAAGVSRKVLDRLIAKHTHETRPPHKFSSALVTV